MAVDSLTSRRKRTDSGSLCPSLQLQRERERDEDADKWKDE